LFKCSKSFWNICSKSDFFTYSSGFGVGFGVAWGTACGAEEIEQVCSGRKVFICAPGKAVLFREVGRFGLPP
jgi:hypothetical protein